MDSRAWLAGLGALAAALVAALVLGRAEPPARGGGRVLPDLDIRKVEAVMLHPGPYLVRDEAGWEIQDRWAKMPADPAAVRELLGTLEMLAIQRRDDGGVDPALGVTIMSDGGPIVELFFEASAGATDRVWASRKGQPGRFLVDGYAVRALTVGVDALREKRPLRGRLEHAVAIRIEAGDRRVEIAGPPWLLADGTRVDPLALQALEDELERLRLTSFTDKPAAGARSALVVIESASSGSSLELGGACAGGGGRAILRSPIGSGCVDDAAIDAILRRADPVGPLVDRRPIAARPEAVEAVRLMGPGAAVSATRKEDGDALRAWLDAVAAAPTGEVAGASGFRSGLRVMVELSGGGEESFAVGRATGGALALRRGDEPVVLLLSPASADLFEPSSYRFRSLELVARDPSDLSSAARRTEAIARGETLEEWRAVRPAGATVDAAAAQRLAEAASALRATRFVSAGAEPSHRLARALDLTFDPAPGATQPEHHTIDLGAATESGGCYARLDRDPVVFELPPDRCAALAAPWTTGASSPR